MTSALAPDEASRALFERYPRLRKKLPHAVLAELPTPVARLEKLGAELGASRLYVKRDDLTARPYGGNKIRKLEFILGKALGERARSVMTFGVDGSNHVVATALYARKMGLECIGMLCPQTNAGYVRKNLLAHLAAGTELRHYGHGDWLRLAAEDLRFERMLLTGHTPMVVAGGGSSPLGTVGFVNAGLELAEQVAAGILPEPDRLYVALGTMGTAAGLLLGLKAAGLRTRLVAVRVVKDTIGNAARLMHLLRQTNELLHHADPDFPLVEIGPADYVLRHEFFGHKYAVFTPEGMAAVKLMADTEGLPLEGTYTGKACAAMLSDLEGGSEQTILFWNTYNSRDLTELIAGQDWTQLPQELQRYFREPLQPLDPGRADH